MIFRINFRFKIIQKIYIREMVGILVEGLDYGALISRFIYLFVKGEKSVSPNCEL